MDPTWQTLVSFFLGADLWANILGGVFAGLIAAWLLDLSIKRDEKKHKIIKDLRDSDRSG